MANEDHIWHCILYEFQLGRKASGAAKNICSALGEGIVSEGQRWFKKFREGNFSLQGETRRGRVSHVLDREALQALLDGNPRTTQQELATALNCTQNGWTKEKRRSLCQRLTLCFFVSGGILEAFSTMNFCQATKPSQVRCIVINWKGKTKF